jgi:hypothetical protein
MFCLKIMSHRSWKMWPRLMLVGSVLTAIWMAAPLAPADESKASPGQADTTKIPNDKAMASIKGLDSSKLPPAVDKKVEFVKDIKPILQKICMDCHDVDGPMGKFRVDKRELVLKGGETGVAIIPGKSAQSPLIYYVSGLVKDMEMPPKDQGDPLTKAQIGLLRAWIDQGAQWDTSGGK